MNRLPVKILLYVALGLGVVIFSILFSKEFSRRKSREITEPSAVQPGSSESAQPLKPAPKAPNYDMLYLALFLACAIPLGLLGAKDISDLVSQQSVDYIFNDEGDGISSPGYEAAEMEVTNGNVLEAVRMLRTHYESHPREVYVALRIAELYEINLHNPLAAALEYEEVLKKKLPAERWGWGAIHLSNLYSGKLGKTEQAMTLLRRIVNEYPKTGAAKKARDRLGISEDAPTAAPSAALPTGFQAKGQPDNHAAPASEHAATAEGEAAEASPGAALPAGFRSKGSEGSNHHSPASETAEPVEPPAPRVHTPVAPKLPAGFRPKDS